MELAIEPKKQQLLNMYSLLIAPEVVENQKKGVVVGGFSYFRKILISKLTRSKSC